MARHRTEPSIALIDGLVALGETLGYSSDPEYPVTGSGGAVDVAWLAERDDPAPLFVFEVETTASSSAANNPLKVFAQPTADLVKPLFFFHVFLSRSEQSERIRLLEQEFGRQNYGVYRLGAGEATRLVIDVLAHHRRVTGDVSVVPLIEALDHRAWKGVSIDEVLHALESHRFSACYIPDYALLSRYHDRFRRHLVRQIAARSPYPYPRDNECWYRTYIGEQWSTPLHLGIAAREQPEDESIFLGSLIEWQEKRDVTRQIGPYFGLSRDYDYFLLGLAAPLWTLTGALFPGGEAKQYCAGELQLLVADLHRLRDPLEAILPALWLLWLAAVADAEGPYETARGLISNRGGVNSRFVEAPPGPLDFDDRQDRWWHKGQSDAVDAPPTIRTFRSAHVSATSTVRDPVKVALNALLDESAAFDWAADIIGALVHDVLPDSLDQ